MPVVLVGAMVEVIPDPVTVNSGSIITVPSNLPHRFSNPGRERLVLLIMNLTPRIEPPETTEEDSQE